MPIILKDYLDTIKAEILTPEIDTQKVKIESGYVSDMLSDVMGSGKTGGIWITIMRHMNSVAVASMNGIPCIVFAKGLRPENAVIERAKQEEICLAISDKSAFELAGILYAMLT